MRLDCGSSLVRDWRESDRAALLRFADNHKVWRNLKDRFPHPSYTAADADAWLALTRAHPERAGWAIEVDSLAVGGIGLVAGQDVHARSAQLGYWLGEPYWGRGIMTDAVRAVAGHALSQLGFRRVEAPVYEWNPASMRVLEKCGFVREGVLKKSVFKDGQLIDSVLYARVAD
ncbi:MAG: GNAT family N-acetyltransferase [Steroidobacteraceae bacterium]